MSCAAIVAGPVIEGAGGGRRRRADGGTCWERAPLWGPAAARPTRNVALDASVVTSLVGQGPDWAVRTGVSIRFGR